MNSIQTYKRRQFLMLTGSLLGLGIVNLAHQIILANNLTSVPVSKGIKIPHRGDVRIVVISDLTAVFEQMHHKDNP